MVCKLRFGQRECRGEWGESYASALYLPSSRLRIRLYGYIAISPIVRRERCEGRFCILYRVFLTQPSTEKRL